MKPRSTSVVRLLYVALTLGIAAARVCGAPPVALIEKAGTTPVFLARSVRVRHLTAPSVTVTVSLAFSDPDSARAYADAVSDSRSPSYRQFLTPRQIADRFGPTQATYDRLVTFLKSNGLAISPAPTHRMTIRAKGAVAQVEKAFGTTLNVYTDPLETRAAVRPAVKTFFANATPVKLPTDIAPLVVSVAGLESHSHIALAARRRRDGSNSGPFEPVNILTAYDLAPLYNAGYQGAGRTVGIANWDGVSLGAAADYATKLGLPIPLTTNASGTVPTNVTIDPVDGGGASSQNQQGEGNVDLQMVLSYAPLCNVRIYDGPNENPTNQQYLDYLSQVVSENAVDLATESYAWNDLAQSDYDGFHNQHLMMTIEGITYCNASGDWGSSLLPNGYTDPFYYPEIDSEVLVVGGTVLTLDSVTNLITSEVAWSGSGGGPDPSGYSTQPTYQTGRGVPVTTGRDFPDVALNADEFDGAYVFDQYDNLTSLDGTSFASPVVCSSLASIESYLIARNAILPSGSGVRRLGRINDALYAFNGRDDVFHDITYGNNGGYFCAPFWDYVTGWGSFDFANTAAALAAPLAVTVTPASAAVNPSGAVQLSANVTGSNVQAVTWSIVSGPGGVNGSGLFTAPTTITGPTYTIVTATSTINTATPVVGSATIETVAGSIISISGTVTLTGSVNEVQPTTFQLQPTAGGTIMPQTVTLTSNGSFTLSNVAAGIYNVAAQGDRWLRSVQLNVDATGAATGVNLTLTPGDLNGDNQVDLNDFNIFVTEYGLSGPNLVADLNCDGQVDLTDFNLLVQSFGESGQSLP